MEIDHQQARARVRRYRQRLRAAGLRPVQIWVPDTRAPGFAEECRRQSLRIAGSPAEQEDLRFLEALVAEATADWENE